MSNDKANLELLDIVHMIDHTFINIRGNCQICRILSVQLMDFDNAINFFVDKFFKTAAYI